MTYSMVQVDGRFTIRQAHHKRALKAVRALRRSREVSLERALLAWRWTADISPAGDLVGLDFAGETLGETEDLLRALAPFVEPGSHLDMRGEDGTLWRWSFDGRTVEEQSAVVTFVPRGTVGARGVTEVESCSPASASRSPTATT